MSKLAEYLTVKAAAEYLGVCPNTLRNWDRHNVIPVRRHPMNGYRLFLKADLEAVLAHRILIVFPAGPLLEQWKTRVSL